MPPNNNFKDASLFDRELAEMQKILAKENITKYMNDHSYTFKPFLIHHQNIEYKVVYRTLIHTLLSNGILFLVILTSTNAERFAKFHQIWCFAQYVAKRSLRYIESLRIFAYASDTIVVRSLQPAPKCTIHIHG